MGDKASCVVVLSDLKKKVSECADEHLKLKEEFEKADEKLVTGRRRFYNKEEEKIWFDAKRKKERKVAKRAEDLYYKAVEYMYRVRSIEESKLLFGHILPNLDSVRYLVELRPPLCNYLRGIPLILPEQREREGEESSQIIVPLFPHGWEGKLLKLFRALSKLEEQLSVLEAEIQVPDRRQWASLSLYKKVEVLNQQDFVCPSESQKDMDLLRKRMELLWYEAEGYKLSAKDQREHFLVTLILTRFEYLVKERAAMIRDYHTKLSEIKYELLKIQPNDGMIWKLTSFPLEPYDVYDELQPAVIEELEDLLQSTVEEYPEDIEEEVVASEPDVVSYLSSSGGELVRKNGDRVSLTQDTFKGKYVWVCCFHVPFLSPWKSLEFLPLINLCNELYSTRDDFEMVMIARMNILADEEEVFRHFFSGFPESCLAVPFKDKQLRDSVFKLVSLANEEKESPTDVLLDPERRVLPIRKYQGYYYHGAQSFPFTEDLLNREYEDCCSIVFDKVGLERVLRCNDSSPDIVYKLNPSGSREEVHISELEDRHVGLYLCASGVNIRILQKMQDKCREAQKEFEIVVVNMPFEANTVPHVHESMIDSLLQKHNVSGWWRLPFNNSVSMRLMRLTHRYTTGLMYDGQDVVMVVGPEVDHLDMYGAHVMCLQGIDAFPFTVNAGIKAAKKQLQEMMTLESLFVDGVVFYRGEDRADTQALLNGEKKIMVCIDRLEDDDDNWDEQFETLASVYEEEKSSDFELVFVEDVSSDLVKSERGWGDSESVGDALREEIVSKMPWYVCPRSKINSGNVAKLARFFHGDSPACSNAALVGFGKDGRICSYRRKHFLEEGGLDFSSLDGDIECELGYMEYNDHRMTSFKRR